VVPERTILFLISMLLCGAVAAQGVPQLASDDRSKAGKIAIGDGYPAKDLFGSVTAPAPLAARAIGSYARGCLAGGVAVPINGPGWQVMRLSRNRNWGHPRLLVSLERLAKDTRSIGWRGLLIGDIAQPRGGPMITGHASHQIGLDADIWLTPMPNRLLTSQEREEMTAVSMLRDPFNVDLQLWTPVHTRLIRLAASYREVERIFVHPAIKQVLCDQAGRDRGWLSKVRPWWGHYYHFHVRIACPAGSAGCRAQPPVTKDDGCGAELDAWFARLLQAERQPNNPAKPSATERPLALGDLPNECRTVLALGSEAAPAPRRTAVDKPAGPPPPRVQFGAGVQQRAPLGSSWGD
jgi:penicillin-insensitive murein DD-endopeptidase